jgi:hypothetical protein
MNAAMSDKTSPFIIDSWLLGTCGDGRMKVAIGLWLKHCKLSASQTLMSSYESISRTHFLNDSYGFPEYRIREISASEIKRFSESLPKNLALTTRRTIVNTLRTFFNWAYKNGFIIHIPQFPTVKISNGVSHVYFVESSGKVKIGYSNDIKRRIVSFKVALPSDVSLLFLIEGGIEVEATLHEKFKDHYSHGEWFNSHELILKYIEENKHLCQKNSLGL